MDRKALVPANASKTVSSQNQFQPLAEFPPLSYHEALFSPKTPTRRLPRRDSPFYHYYTKPAPLTDLYLTPEHEPLSQAQIEPYLTKLFPKNFLWFPDDPRKTREFYEKILEDSNSALISHRMCETDPNKINFSKLKIQKILSLSDWQSPSALKAFVTPYSFPGYSYTDYKNAWTFALLVRPNHSWFIFFDRKCNDNIPVWFYHWWYHFGATSDIFPDTARLAYDYYVKHSPDKEYTRPLRFHRDTGLAWIVCWTLETIQLLPKPFPLSLCRKYKIRWWEKFDLNTLSVEKSEELVRKRKLELHPSSPQPPILPTPSASNIPPDQLQQWKEFQAFQQFLTSQKQTVSIQSPESTSSTPPETDDPEHFAQDPYDF